MKSLFICLMALASWSVFAGSNMIKIDPTTKWNGIGSHPSKKLSYLKSNDFGKCDLIAFTYAYLNHSPKVPAIISAFCIVSLAEGVGINKKNICVILDIDWDGRHHPSYIKEGKIAVEGLCNATNVATLKTTLNKHTKSLAKMIKGSKLSVVRDIYGVFQ